MSQQFSISFFEMMNFIHKDLTEESFIEIDTNYTGNELFTAIRNLYGSIKFKPDYEQLREKIQQLNDYGCHLTNKDKENKYVVLLAAHLMELERKSTWEDLKSTTQQLSRSLKLHENFINNTASKLELIIKNALVKYLENKQFEVDLVNHDDGKIYGSNKDKIVQWDAILYAEKQDLQYLFLVEVKQTFHPDDVDKLNSRLDKTQHYFNLLDSKYCSKNWNKKYTTQNNVYRAYADCQLIAVVASEQLNDDIKSKVDSMGSSFAYMTLDPEIKFSSINKHI